jgi:uncharacterized LabA/DUF88 family protein
MIKKGQDIYAFIDSQNLNLSIKGIGWELDFFRFRHYLKDKFHVQNAYLFIGYHPGNEKLYKSLQEYGYILIFKPTLEYRGKIKGNCDAELVLHCMIHKPSFSRAIIVSGDGDFHCLIEHLLEDNKLLKVGIPNRDQYSALLRKFTAYMFFISDLKEKLEYKKGASEKGRNPNPSSLS